MHYGQYLGSTKVMTPKQSGASIGQRQQLSTKDIQGLNEYYCSGPGKKCCNDILSFNKTILSIEFHSRCIHGFSCKVTPKPKYLLIKLFVFYRRLNVNIQQHVNNTYSNFQKRMKKTKPRKYIKLKHISVNIQQPVNNA